MSKTRFFTCLLFLLALAAMNVLADQAVDGTVKDNTGGVIPGVSVTLTSIDTGATRQSVTDDNGYFVFNQIRPGNYDMKVELEGFQPQKVAGLKVAIGDKLTQNFTMLVSELTTEVEVKAAAEQVETTTSQLDTVIDEKRITDLPLNGRNPLDLIYLTPGVVQSQSGYASANGNRARSNNYMLDGFDNNYTQTVGTMMDVNVDATAEFRVVTSNPSAEYGRAAGAVVDVLTKSGTNQFHGNAFYFIRAENLDAKAWDENFYGADKGDYKRHQMGASVGGPVLKDKLFFFFNTEWLKIRQQSLVTSAVPTAEWKATVVNTEMARIFNTYYPLPNSTVDVVPGVSRNYYFSAPAPYDSEQYTLKMDFNQSVKHTISGRYMYNTYNDPKTPQLPQMANTRDAFGSSQNWAVDWTWIASPTMVNSMRLGFTRAKFNWVRDDSIMDLSFAGSRSTDTRRYFVDFGGPAGYGSERRALNTYQVKDTLTWTLNTHNIKIGMDLRWNQSNGGSGFDVIPTVFFDPWLHGGTSQSNIRNGVADYTRTGIYSDGHEYVPGMVDYRGWRWHEYDFFVQDDWKIKSNLTLNIGLRYEYKPAPFEINNKLSNIFDPLADGYHIVNQLNFFDPANWQGGNWRNYRTGGVSQWLGNGADISLVGPDTGNKLYEASNTNFAPRLGVSWDPFSDGKTAIRGGYGISFDRMVGNYLTWSTSQLPFGASNYLDAQPGGTYNGMYPGNIAYYGHGQPPPPLNLHVAAGSFLDYLIYNSNFASPYVQTWNVSAQRELWPGNILNITYAGSAGVHLIGRTNPNQMPHPTAEFIQALSTNVGASAINTMPSYILQYCANNTQFQRLSVIDPYVHSDYHALQTYFSHRYQNGLQFQLNYTWSKAFDNNSEGIWTEGNSSPFASDYYNLDYDRGFAAFDVRHIFSANFIYELPFGPGKLLGGQSEGVLAALIGGWQVNGIFQATAGYPLDYKVARDTLGTGYTTNRGPARPNIRTYELTLDTANNIVGPVATNFTDWRTDINMLHPQGDYYRGKFRGPGFWNVDFSMFKEVKIPWITSEGAKIQFRAEAFNLLNHTNWNNPNTTLTSSNLGKVFSAATNRQVQFGLKFIF